MHRGNGKPRVHARDHEHGGADPQRIVYEDVGDTGDGGGGGGIQFDTSPQTGGFLEVTTTTGAITLESTGAGAINLYSGTETVNLVGDGIIITSDGDNGIVLEVDDDGDLILQIHAPTTNLRFVGLPTSDPGGHGCIWNNAGVLNITT